jgi:hypothetical protein
MSAERALPLELPFLIVNNAIEYQRKLTGPSYYYERDCFLWLAKRFPNMLVTGPKLTEKLLAYCRLNSIAQPDVLIFEYGKEGVTLNRMAEIKSVDIRSKSTTRKISGFIKITDVLRGNQKLMAGAIDSCIGDDLIHVPETILVPQDSMIEVFFVSPQDNSGKQPPPNSPFPVSYLTF